MTAVARHGVFGAFHRRRLAAPQLLPWLLVPGVAIVAGTMTWLMEHGSYDTWAAIPVVIGLLVISVPLLRHATSIEEDPRIARLLWWAFGLKLLGALPRYAVAFGVYDGQADAAAYSRIGGALARQFRNGDFVIDLGRRVQGTGFIEIVTGAVYTVTGATDIGGFFVFAWMGFWGLYLFHRAFVRACPDGDHWRYALLVFLLPSLLFWPSSIGKEAWMCLGLGLVAYAGSRMLTGARGGLPLLAHRLPRTRDGAPAHRRPGGLRRVPRLRRAAHARGVVDPGADRQVRHDPDPRRGDGLRGRSAPDLLRRGRLQHRCHPAPTRRGRPPDRPGRIGVPHVEHRSRVRAASPRHSSGSCSDRSRGRRTTRRR